MQVLKPKMPRSQWPAICGIIACALLSAPDPLGAHDGPHGPDVLARVLSTELVDTQVAITLELTGLGGPIVLTGLSAPAATSAPMAPVYINFAQDVIVRIDLAFAGTVPSFFNLTLLFGPLGEVAVGVAP